MGEGRGWRDGGLDWIPSMGVQIVPIGKGDRRMGRARAQPKDVRLTRGENEGRTREKGHKEGAKEGIYIHE